ncbi:MAG: questin oxidase family protein [Burkholderiaceae bacterium]
MTSAVLEALLDANVHHHAEYGHELSNHLPMALVALHGLGASEARLEAWAAGYRGRLAPAPLPVVWIGSEPWKDRFGTPDAWPAYRSLFAQWLLHEGRDAVLAQVLPALMPGCGAAAFHGLIRSACALRAGHAGELTDGLAYWAWRYLPIEPAALDGREDDPGAVLDMLGSALADTCSDAGLIADRMRDAAAQPAFGPIVARLRVGDETLAALTRVALTRYAEGGDFTVLHLVTACHAMHALLPWLDEPLSALRSFWAACAAGAASVRPRPAPLALTVLPAWPEITARAIASDDEHVIKLVWACTELDRLHGWEACRSAAARAVVPG